MLIVHCTRVEALVLLRHILQSQEAVLVTQTRECTFVREHTVVVAPFHGEVGLGTGDFASESDRAGHYDSLVCQVADDCRSLRGRVGGWVREGG